jgi:hypothetical protein
MCALQPQALQELRTQIQTVEEDLRAATCRVNLEKPIATLAATMRSLLEDCPLGLSPACSVSTDGVPGSITSEATTADPQSTTLLAERAETLADSVCRMDGLKASKKSGGVSAAVASGVHGNSLRGSPTDKLGKQRLNW